MSSIVQVAALLHNPSNIMCDAKILAAEDPRVHQSPAASGNVGNSTQICQHPNKQHVKAQSALAGASTVATAKPSPVVPESTAVSFPPLCPATLGSAGRDDQPAFPPPSGLRSGPGIDQSTGIGNHTSDSADRPPAVSVPPADLSPAHRQPATQLEPALSDGRSVTSKRSVPSALSRGRAHAIAPGQSESMLSDVIGEGSVSTVPKPPAPDAPAALPGPLVPSVDEPLLPVPLQQGNPVNGPAQGEAGKCAAKPFDGKDTGVSRAAAASYKTSALAQARQALIESRCRDQAASDKAPARDQASAASNKPETGSSADVNSNSGGSNPGAVQPVQHNKLGQAEDPVTSDVAKPAGPGAGLQSSPEGMNHTMRRPPLAVQAILLVHRYTSNGIFPVHS